MKNAKSILLTALLFAASTAGASVAYQIDDGKGDNAWTFTNGDTTWANRFAVIPGGSIIDKVQIAFGSPGAPDLSGQSVTVKLWSDPNSDANPGDAVLLTSLVGTIANWGTDVFNEYDITDTLVSGNFFVGATVVYDPNQVGTTYPARVDTTGDGADSWLWTTGFDPVNMADVGSTTFMIRAIGGSASVPEPASLALLGLGLAGIGAMRRRKY